MRSPLGLRGELFPIVRRALFRFGQRAGIGCVRRLARTAKFRVLACKSAKLCIPGGGIDVPHVHTFLIGVDNRVGLRVSDAAFCCDYRRRLIEIHAPRYQSAPQFFALALVVFVVCGNASLQLQRAPVFLVFPDMLIHARVTDKGDAILRQTPADPIGTPLLLRQFFFDQSTKSGVICAARPRPLGVSASFSRALA